MSPSPRTSVSKSKCIDIPVSEVGLKCLFNFQPRDSWDVSPVNVKISPLLRCRCDHHSQAVPLGPLQAALTDTFLSCGPNRSAYFQFIHAHQAAAFPDTGTSSSVGISHSNHFSGDVVLLVQDMPIEAHRVILSARSPFFKTKFETDWKDCSEVIFLEEGMFYSAVFTLIYFFYSDKLDIAKSNIEDLMRICRICQCESLLSVLEKELMLQKQCAKFTVRRNLGRLACSNKYVCIPEEDRLPAALNRIFQVSQTKAAAVQKSERFLDRLALFSGRLKMKSFVDDLTDVCIRVDMKIFRCHRVILASRSDYFAVVFSRGRKIELPSLSDAVLYLVEHDVDVETFEKIVKYMYTDYIPDIDPDQAEEMFYAASKYLLFPLIDVIADMLLPNLEMASPAELCYWLLLSDKYYVSKIREYCLETIADDFWIYSSSPEFRAMLSTLAQSSRDSLLSSDVPCVPGPTTNISQGSLLNDLRKKWIEANASTVEERDERTQQQERWIEAAVKAQDERARLFDERLEKLMKEAHRENSYDLQDTIEHNGQIFDLDL